MEFTAKQRWIAKGMPAIQQRIDFLLGINQSHLKFGCQIIECEQLQRPFGRPHYQATFVVEMIFEFRVGSHEGKAFSC